MAEVPCEVRLLDAAFSPAAALERFFGNHTHAGGVASFTGQVRASGGVSALELTHYEPLTLSGMQDLAKQAVARFSLAGVLVWHRIGIMAPGDPIVLVATAAPHRREALQAVDFLMDHLKSAAWFWKREQCGGQWRWIEPRPQDHADLARWN